MGKNHRFFHRRAAQAATQVVTVNVEVISTVDTNGDPVAQETFVPQTPSQPTIAAAAAATVSAPSSPSAVVAQAGSPMASASQMPSVPQASLPQVPSVPSVPTVAIPSLPSVPSVPPFPSDLIVPTVPAYPFSSGIAVVQAVASTSPVISPAVSTTLAGTGATPASSPAPVSAIGPGSNSTILSSNASFLSASSFLPSGSVSGASSLSASRTLVASSGLPSFEVSTGATTRDSAATSYYGGSGGGGAPGNFGGPPAATTAAPVDADSGSTPAPLETPQVVGSVVGSLAGAALILAIILLLIRRHKRRRGGALQLTGDDHTDHDHPMRQAPPRASIVPSAFLHRFSGMSRSTADTSISGGERSFQRVSGRKLPSAFSEGMTSEQFSRGGTMSGSSFYQDDHGVYGGPGLAKDLGKEVGATSTSRGSGQMNFRPSPARTPIIRHPDDIPSNDPSHLSPPQSPNPDFPTRGTLGRSLPSADGSRSSRFTENV